jgi:hypothetical protein
MPKLTLDIPHSLDSDEAVRRLKEKIAAARQEHGAQLGEFSEEWSDQSYTFSFRALGTAVSGTILVEPQKLQLALHLPLAAMLLKGVIAARIRHEVDAMMAETS